MQEDTSEPEAPPDADQDGILDEIDYCLDTVLGCEVDEAGCAIDSDGDDLCDGLDDTPDGKAAQSPPPTTETQDENAPLQNAPADEDTEISTNTTKTTSSSFSGDSFAPFLIGLVLGMVLTAAFFLVIRM